MATSTTSSTNHSDKIESKLKDARHAAAELANEVKDAASDKLEDAEGKLSEVWSDVKDKAISAKDATAEQLASGRKHAMEAFKHATAWMKERPLQTAAIGLGVGFILAKVISRDK